MSRGSLDPATLPLILPRLYLQPIAKVRIKHRRRLVSSQCGSSALTVVVVVEPARAIPQSEATPELHSLSQLSEALAEFQGTYAKFIEKNKDYLLIDAEVQEAFKNADNVKGDIRKAAVTFADGIWDAIRTIEQRNLTTQGKWTSKLGHFMTKLYPVATLSVGLAGAVGQVWCFSPRKLIIGYVFLTVTRNCNRPRRYFTGIVHHIHVNCSYSMPKQIKERIFSPICGESSSKPLSLRRILPTI